MNPAVAEPINSYLIQCVIFMAIVPVIATIVAIVIAVRMKKKGKQEAAALPTNGLKTPKR